LEEETTVWMGKDSYSLLVIEFAESDEDETDSKKKE
jgi:hypothetical protein